MKKTITILAVAFLLTGTAFASEKNNSGVPISIKNDFNKHFNQATELSWESGSTFYKASFDKDYMHLYAFYSLGGNFIGVSRNINFRELPLSLQRNITRKYSNCWISDIVEFSNNEGTTYYLNFKNADQVITLKGTNGYWEVADRTDVK
jgi:hypothetical protein